MINIVVYTKPECTLCDEVIEKLNSLQEEYPHNLVLTDISTDNNLEEKFGKSIPVVKTGPFTLSGRISLEELKMTLGAAIDRREQLVAVGDETYKGRIERGTNITKTDKVTQWLADGYIWLIGFFLLLYVGLPFMAPVFMKAGMTGPANVIYTIYRPLCHQLAFRSFFIGGEQPYYPRELAGIEGVITYEELIHDHELDIREAQHFNGNDVVGYKVAFCQRDIAIYAAMFLFTLIFIISGRRIKSLPWYIWLAIGIIPIGLDGTSQLPGLLSSLPDWLPMPIRESTPFLRVLTGSLFGFTTSWYLFPLIEESMRETKVVVDEKIKIANLKQND